MSDVAIETFKKEVRERLIFYSLENASGDIFSNVKEAVIAKFSLTANGVVGGKELYRYGLNSGRNFIFNTPNKTFSYFHSDREGSQATTSTIDALNEILKTHGLIEYSQ